MSKPASEEKDKLHPRNRYRGRYDFPKLIGCCPELSNYVLLNKYQNLSIDFNNPEAVKILNKALLSHFYDIKFWDIPEGYLCPPIPGRADYIHYVADLLASQNYVNLPRGAKVKVLDIGTGANCIYPLIGHKEYGWKFVGSDIDKFAIRSANNIIAINDLSDVIEVRKQSDISQTLQGVIRDKEIFDLTICNPPFHASLNEATQGSMRKWKNLGKSVSAKVMLNFGGKNAELWCEGGEERFVINMIEESAAFSRSCRWFTSLISKKETLQGCYKALKRVKASDVKTISMAQGNKISRILAWTFLDQS